MISPFETLGVRAWATPDEIRAAYRALVKKCHPDMVQDPAQKRAAQEQMVRLNLAYEEALRLASPHQYSSVSQELTVADAVLMAEKMLSRGNPENALRQLMRAGERNGAWFYTQGLVLMEMEEYETAHQSFREAVRRSPENNEYRRGALEAAVAAKKARTIPGMVHKVFRRLIRK